LYYKDRTCLSLFGMMLVSILVTNVSNCVLMQELFIVLRPSIIMELLLCRLGATRKAFGGFSMT
jgi:hypothetical protein